MAYATISGPKQVAEGSSALISLNIFDISSANFTCQHDISTAGGTASSSDQSAGVDNVSMAISAIPSTSRSIDMSFNTNSDNVFDEADETVFLEILLSGVALLVGSNSPVTKSPFSTLRHPQVVSSFMMDRLKTTS